jgi:SAM-dependent methyltransferase
MSNFGGYANYYDLLYRDKDYRGEAVFVREVLSEYCPNLNTVIELGCGTGLHAKFLAEDGLEVHGVDLSDEMLNTARERLASLPAEVSKRLHFSQGDVRSVRLNERADAVVSLFHVISYQTTNKDLLAAFMTAKEHLKKDGVFLFDVWYGPAVLRNFPGTRVKRLEDENVVVTRLAEPLVNPNDNTVDVHYQVFIKRKADGAVEEIREVHPMRYLFRPELEAIARQAGLEIIDAFEWLTKKTPGFDTWGVCFVGRCE